MTIPKITENITVSDSFFYDNHSSLFQGRKFYIVTVTDRVEEKILAVSDNLELIMRISNFFSYYKKDNAKVSDRQACPKHLIFHNNQVFYQVNENEALPVRSKNNMNVIKEMLELPFLPKYFDMEEPSPNSSLELDDSNHAKSTPIKESTSVIEDFKNILNSVVNTFTE